MKFYEDDGKQLEIEVCENGIITISIIDEGNYEFPEFYTINADEADKFVKELPKIREIVQSEEG